MIHRFSQQGIYLVVDVNSGCVHIMDKLAYDILGELEGAQGCSPVPAADFGNLRPV